MRFFLSKKEHKCTGCQAVIIRGDETDAIRAILDKRCWRHHKLKKIIDDIMV